MIFLFQKAKCARPKNRVLLRGFAHPSAPDADRSSPVYLFKVQSPWELMDPRTKNDSDKTQDILIPFDPLTAHKTDILIKQLLCQFEGLLVF